MRKVAIFEPYLFDRVYGNSKYILGVFKYAKSQDYLPILVSQTENATLEVVSQRGGRTCVLPAPKRLQRFGGALLRGGTWSALATAASISRYTATLHRYFRQEMIDIVQCHSIRSLLVAGMAAKTARKPLLWYVKGHLANPRLDRIGFALADKILFQAETNRNRCYPDLVKRYANKIEILANGVDLEEIEAATARDQRQVAHELGIDNCHVNICFLGQISEPKGVHVLIQAMSEVVAKVPNVRLYLVGDAGIPEYADYQSRLEASISAHGLAEFVRFTGFRDDAVSILNLMDFLVLPSLAEGVPRSIMEGMALGKPVIATPVGGVPELVVPGKTGFLVPVGDSHTLAHDMTKLATCPELRRALGKCGRDLIYERHSLQRNVQGLSRIYDSVL